MMGKVKDVLNEQQRKPILNGSRKEIEENNIEGVEIKSLYPEEDEENILLSENEGDMLKEYNNMDSSETAGSSVDIDIPDTISYTKQELESCVKQIAGAFYASYIAHYHPEQLKQRSENIRKEAAKEIIEFGKALLTQLKKEN
jgi:predicted metal-dependent hydrolase